METWVVVGLVAAVLVWLAAVYNRLVATRNKVEEAWSGIDVQLTRRADLVPQLVETVKGYQLHEQQVLASVTDARTRAVQAEGPRASGRADDLLEGALQRLFAVAEAYPDLKASESFLSLQRDLVTLEEDISFARRYYNALVERLNTAIQRFPTMLVAGPLGFRPAEYFKADADAAHAPAAGFRP
ncbi:MAG TPA: LemA family protein [Egibacteraceae bacterium]|nr:LemA family protein [Egibacteraceae bacterium]